MKTSHGVEQQERLRVVNPFSDDVRIISGIFRNLQPRHLIRLRQACRSWYTASKSRDLWIHLLRRVCREDNIFEPTYQVEAMTDLDLEHAATRPSRFLSRLHSRNVKESLQAYDDGFLSFDDLRNEGCGVSESLRCLYAVPGGRFLVTSHLKSPDFRGNEYTRYLNVWDLGWLTPIPESELDSVKLTPIATKVDHGTGSMSPVHPTRDGKGLLVLARADDYVKWSSEQERIQAFYIYEIYPNLNFRPLELGIVQNLRHVGKLTLRMVGKEKCCFSFEHLAIVYGDETIMVWNFVNNTGATWEVPPRNDDLNMVHTVMIDGNRIILVRDVDLLIWDIPELHSCVTDELAAFDRQTIMPTWTCPLDPLIDPQSHQPFRFSVDRLDDWYMDSGGPLYFDIVFDSAPDPADPASAYGIMDPDPQEPLPTTYRYQLTIPDNLVCSFGLPVLAHTVLRRIAAFYHPATPRYDDFVAKFYRISQGDIVNSMIRHDKDLYIYNYRGTAGTPTISYLTLPEVPEVLLQGMNENYAAVCPSSGRIFTFLQRNSGEVGIAETVRHPKWRPQFCDLPLRIYDPDTDPTRDRFNRGDENDEDYEVDEDHENDEDHESDEDYEMEDEQVQDDGVYFDGLRHIDLRSIRRE